MAFVEKCFKSDEEKAKKLDQAVSSTDMHYILASEEVEETPALQAQYDRVYANVAALEAEPAGLGQPGGSLGMIP
jgi:hypothetical protein